MRILIAFDINSYSAGIIGDVAKLAANTWADITMLGVQQDVAGDAPEENLATTLTRYREEFIGKLGSSELPYERVSGQEGFILKNDYWELADQKQQAGSRKKLLVKIRKGDPTKEILAEAQEQESDLIVLGCTKGLDCQWKGEIDLPQKIAKKATCSILVIKEKKLPDTIICCLDQAHVSQSSLEMINQVVTLHQAELKIIGLTSPKKKTGKEGVENKMAEILQYYADRQINAWVKLVQLNDLEEYVSQASREGMIALWMGKKSLLGKIFSHDLIGKLVNNSQSSVLILR